MKRGMSAAPLLTRDDINAGRNARRQAEFVMSGDHRRFPRGVSPFDREADSEGFDLHAHESQVVDFLWRIKRDEETLVRLRLDQPLLGETRQRFAHDAYADTVLRAQVGELQAVIGLVVAADQLAPQIQMDSERDDASSVTATLFVYHASQHWDDKL